MTSFCVFSGMMYERFNQCMSYDFHNIPGLICT